MTMIVGFDLAPRKCGWCAGDGSRVPTAGGFALPQCGDDFGQLLENFRRAAIRVLDDWKPDVVIVEKPILPTQGGKFKNQVMGSLQQRRGQLCMGPFLEWLCLTRGIACEDADISEVKRELGVSRKDGDSDAQKAAMVRVALKMGIELPPTLVGGREDAADAVGCWKVGVRYHAKQFLPVWDQRVYGRRGALL